jgi:hypothetical protein
MDIRKITRPVGQPANHAGRYDLNCRWRAFARSSATGPTARVPISRHSRKSKRPPRPRDRGALLPIVSGKVTTRMPEHFGAACDLPGPVLAYCRTGTRSTTLVVAGQGGRGPNRCPTSWPPPRRPATTWPASCAASPMAARPPPMWPMCSASTSSSSAAAPPASPLPRACSPAQAGLDIAIIDPPTCITTSPAGPWSAAASSNRESPPAPWAR